MSNSSIDSGINRKQRKKKRAKAIYIFIAVLVLLFCLIYVIPSIGNNLSRTETIKYGKLRVGKTVTGYYLRNDTVYVAGLSAVIEKPVAGGTKVRKNSKIMRFSGGERDINENSAKYRDIINNLKKSVVTTRNGKANSSGVVSYVLDGQENYFSPSNAGKLTLKEAKRRSKKDLDIRRRYCFEGDPVFKISADNKWYIAFWVKLSDIADFETGQNIKVYFGDKEYIEANVRNIKETDDGWRIILESKDYHRTFADKRCEEINVVTSDDAGLIISNDCITMKDKHTGVLVRNVNGKYDFVRVSVLSTDGEKSVVKSNMFYDENGEAVYTVKPFQVIKKKPGAIE